MVRNIVPAVCALLMVFFTGCSGDTDSSSSQEAPQAAEGSSAAAESSEVTLSYTPRTNTGEKLKAVYDIISKGTYTFECELTGTNVPEPIRITRIVSGNDSYQLQQEKLGDHGTVTFSGKSYDFDYVCGMYRESTEAAQPGIIEQIVKGNVPRTETAVKDERYDIEQYTYTGDTFITVIDFYFDKKDGHLMKYDMTYSVEGRDNIVETRTVLRLDNEADTSVFNAYFADTLVNFDSMSEPQKQGFCQGLCATWGITADEMFDLGVSSDSLDKIDYDTLFTLIHTCGKPRTGQDGDSSSPAESLGEPEGEDTSGEESSAAGSEKDSSSEADEGQDISETDTSGQDISEKDNEQPQK